MEAATRAAIRRPASRSAAASSRPLLEWLRERIHRRGAIEDADVIIGRATGAELSAQPFIDYLWAKYGDLYGLTR